MRLFGCPYDRLWPDREMATSRGVAEELPFTGMPGQEFRARRLEPLVAVSVSTKRRQEADFRHDGPAGQSQLSATPGEARYRPSLCENPLTPRLTDP